jgi:N-acetylmuramoyl-L-alanine amidase
MNLQKLFLTKNDCYKEGKKLIPTGIMVHSTGLDNSDLKRYVGPDDGLLGKNPNNNHWNQPKPDGRAVCPHAFIGKLGVASNHADVMYWFKEQKKKTVLSTILESIKNLFMR